MPRRCRRATRAPDEAYAAAWRAAKGRDASFDDPSETWRTAEALLSHRHQWVQQAAARVVGHYLAKNGAAMAAAMAKDGAREEDAPVSFRRVARASTSCLEQGCGARAVEVDPGLAEQTVKNLTFATVVLLQTAASGTPDEAEKEDAETEEGREDTGDGDAPDAETEEGARTPATGRARRGRRKASVGVVVSSRG